MNIKKVLALFAIALASAFSAHAAEKLYWTGNAGDFKWSSADNWALGSASGDAPQSLEPATAIATTSRSWRVTGRLQWKRRLSTTSATTWNKCIACPLAKSKARENGRFNN